MIFDSHAHYLSGKFDEDREELIKSVLSSNVIGVIECATDKDNIDRAVELSETHSGVYCALGVHPHTADQYDDELEAKLIGLSEKCVAIGEIGLDYHYDFCERDIQRSALARQIELAKRLDKPVILHSRESTADMLDILKARSVSRGVMHCFSGSPETAKILLDMGLYIGVGGSLTFKGAVKAVEIVKMLPLERLLLETDCPYLAPVPHRGERNDSRLISVVSEKIAEIKGVDKQAVEEAAYENAKRLFNIG